MKKATSVTTTAVLTYAQRLNQSAQEIEAQELGFQVEEGSQQLQADVLATRKLIAALGQKLNKAKSARPFNSANILNAQRDLEDQLDNLRRLEDLQTELFPA